MTRRHGGALIAVLSILAVACSRSVQAESEAVPSQTTAPAQFDVVGTYDYIVDLPDEDATGPMTVTRAADGSYGVTVISHMGDVALRNVRRAGNTLTMDASTPGGEGTIELTWESRDRASGIVFLGEAFTMVATRRP